MEKDIIPFPVALATNFRVNNIKARLTRKVLQVLWSIVSPVSQYKLRDRCIVPFCRFQSPVNVVPMPIAQAHKQRTIWMTRGPNDPEANYTMSA